VVEDAPVELLAVVVGERLFSVLDEQPCYPNEDVVVRFWLWRRSIHVSHSTKGK
jgi:hypothetical protein